MTNEAKEFLIWMCERAESITLQAFRVESNCDELTLFGADDRVIGRFIDVDGWFEVGGARAIAALEPTPAPAETGQRGVEAEGRRPASSEQTSWGFEFPPVEPALLSEIVTVFRYNDAPVAQEAATAASDALEVTAVAEQQCEAP